MFYNELKILHVMSASLLMGITLVGAFYLFIAHRSNNQQFIYQTSQQILKPSWTTIISAGLFQLISGFILVALKSRSFTTEWIALTLLSYGTLSVLLVIIWYLQLKSIAYPLPQQYRRYYLARWILGIIAYAILIVIYYLMTHKPN